MSDLSHIPFKMAKWYTPVLGSPRQIDLIVVHDMEAPEKGSTAQSVAKYFADGCEGRKASAHYCIDNGSVVQCVQCRDVAYGAKGVNHNGIHIEHAGYASQSVQDWQDAFSLAMLKLSAQLVREVLAPKFDIPIVFVDAHGLGSGKRGITTHAEASKAFNPGGHSDPGPNFPMDLYLRLCQGN